MNLFDIKKTIKRVYESDMPDKRDIVELLKITDDGAFRALTGFADAVRKECCGDGVLVRGIIEFSNRCDNACAYCGINKNRILSRYILNEETILEQVELMDSLGIKTVVLQAGEDRRMDPVWLKNVILSIKNKYGMAVTLSVGERPVDDYIIWKNAGADRYLLKIEVSSDKLYSKLHPGMEYHNRIKALKELDALGYQTGSGNIIGIKGQTVEDLAEDILFFKAFDLDMIGMGPFVPHPGTDLYDMPKGEKEMVLKVLAITRIVVKNVHLPAASALGSGKDDYQLAALDSGANVIMPNFTPDDARSLYEIYPQRKCMSVEPQGYMENIMKDLKKRGRHLDFSVGHTIKKQKRRYQHV